MNNREYENPILWLRIWWAGDFVAGNAVIHKGRNAHVIPAEPGIVPVGNVPIMYDDETDSYSFVPADDLNLRFASNPR